MQKTKRFDGDKRPKEQIIEERNAKNRRQFFQAYPDLEEVQIKNMKQFDRNAKGRTNIKNPDMSFCAFLLSFSMCLLSLLTFYNHRDFNNEYSSRQLLYQRLVNPSVDENNFKKLHDISTVNEVRDFLESTVALQLFPPADGVVQNSPYVF